MRNAQTCCAVVEKIIERREGDVRVVLFHKLRKILLVKL